MMETFMKYGSFIDNGRSYCITRPDTPRPWMNVLFNDEYGLFFSQTGQGYSFYKSVLDMPITYVDLFTYVPQWPQSGKFVYLRDEENQDHWSLAPFYADQKYDSFQCRHTPGFSTIETSKNGISSRFEIFVPVGSDPLEIWTITLKNTGPTPRRLRFYPFHELRLASYGSGITDVFTYALSDFNPDCQALISHNNNSVAKFMYGTFMAADYPIVGYDCRLESFIGNYGRMETPQAVQAGRCTNSSVSAERLCNVLEGVAELAPGEEKTFHLAFGIGSDTETVKSFQAAYLAPGQPAAARAAVADYWQDQYQRMSIETPFEGLNILSNTWFKHGSLLTSRYVRGGVKGYRDIVQDVMGSCPLDPAWTRRWLLESLRHQQKDGLVIRCYDPIAGDDDLRMHRDCGLWLPISFSEFVRETGDDAILDQVIPYRDSGQDTAWQHMIANILRVGNDRGAHNLCLIGDGDWNDSLDGINRNGGGESAWLTVATIYAINMMEELSENTGRSEGISELLQLKAELSQAVNENAWDGSWYVYGFGDNGQPIGTHKDKEGQIHLNMQTWAIFSGLVEKDRLPSLLNVIDNTVASRFGPLLIHPPYTKYDKGIGKMSAKNPGHCENGPVYGHGVCFKMLADAALGRGNEAMDSFLKLSPFNPESNADIYRGEPFAAQRYLVSYANPEQEGAGWYPFFTATPAWMMYIVYQQLLGLRPWYNGLRIDPVIPESWDGYKVTRQWRGATYILEVKNPEHVSSGVTELLANGQAFKDNLIPIAPAGSTVEITCLLGPGGTRPGNQK
jgi:cellobiose phosphorylase